MFSSKQALSEKKKELYSKTKEKMESIKYKVESEFNTSNMLFVSDRLVNDSYYKGPITKPLGIEQVKNLDYDGIMDSLISSCLSFDTSLINERKKEELRYLSLSQDPMKLDYSLENKKFVFEHNAEMKPIGISGTIKEIVIEDNIKIPGPVDKLINDEVRANYALNQLSKNGFEVEYLSNVLSSGFLGIDKKLVPTRWGITATDDTIGKENIKEIREFPELDEIKMFTNEFLHNIFFVILLPGKWEYEQFELWESETGFDFNQEYEPFFGRTNYAKDQGGGYYAARIVVTEYLKSVKKQARVLVIRYIKKEYFFPVGVWQVRENVRNSFKNSLKVGNISEAKQEITKSLQVDISDVYKCSHLLIQRRIGDTLSSLKA